MLNGGVLDVIKANRPRSRDYLHSDYRQTDKTLVLVMTFLQTGEIEQADRQTLSHTNGRTDRPNQMLRLIVKMTHVFGTDL